MADRKNSDAPQHETYPGPGPAPVGDGTTGVHPVEQMVDAAIDRIAREYEATRDVRPEHVLAVRTSKTDGTGRLRWKGLDVSDEFRRYAERVAQGEDLPPYAGRILAEPHPTFPWEPSARRKASRRARALKVGLWGSAAVVVSLLAWSLVVKMGSPKEALLLPLEPAPSQAVLAIQGSAEQRPALDPSAPLPPPPPPEEPAVVEASIEDPSGALALNVPAEPPAAAGALPSASPAAPPVVVPAPAAPPAAMIPKEAPSPPPAKLAPPNPPGTSRTAMGSALAAKAVPNDLIVRDVDAAYPVQGAGNATEAPPPAGAVGKSEAVPAPAAGARPAAPPSEPVKPGTARKETASQSSGKGSLLVETPSF
jgi:hypothetical protein